MKTINLTWNEVHDRAQRIRACIAYYHPNKCPVIYGIPRGGIFPAVLIAGALGTSYRLTENPAEATVFIDDIVDSGTTCMKWRERYPNIPFYALVDKLGKDADWVGSWISFPWERMGNEDSPSDNIRRLLQYIGEDPNREGLKETPDRVIRSYDTLFGGYKQKPEDVIKVFEDGACDEMVMLRGCEFVSCCEHHMLPFLGKAHIAYIPDKSVIGVSKLARVLDIYARRLQIQERIGDQVTKCLMEHLQPKGAACVLEAQHSCMTCRGVMKQNAVMVTSSLTGVFREDARTRAEFFAMVKG